MQMGHFSCIMHFFFNFQSWDVFFRNSTAGAPPGQAYVSPYSLSQASAPLVAPPTAGTGLDLKVIDDHLAVQAIIRSYQVRKYWYFIVVKTSSS